jgi:hypothetical protein
MFIERLVKVREVIPRKLPNELRKALGAQDLKAIKRGSSYFGDLAKKARFPWLKRVLQQCAADQDPELEFYATGDNPFVPYFRFSWGGGPAICLPRGEKAPSELPPALKHLYSLIGGFQENEFGYAGGMFRLSQLECVGTSWIWVSSDSEVAAKDATMFLQTFGGDLLCYLPDGGAAWYSDGKLKRSKNLEKEIARYFNALLKGTRI